MIPLYIIKNKENMRKLMLVFGIALALASCKSKPAEVTTDSTEVVADSTAVAVDTTVAAEDPTEAPVEATK